jgi:uncharacterized damage-inducible protein DinB
MKELLKQQAAFNYWANQRLVDTILAIPEGTGTTETPSSFNSLQKTLLHIWDAESGWWQRLRLQERLELPGKTFTGELKDATAGLLQQSKTWEEWVKQASPNALDHVIQFQTNKRELVKIKTCQLLLHVFNHSTYHRGQLVTMLHQLGYPAVPATDFFLWLKLKK